MEDLPKVQYMEKRRNRWYMRLTLSKDLKVIYGKTAIIRSLGTSDYYEAKTQLAILLAKWRLDFEEKRKSLQSIADDTDMLSKYTEAELERLAKAYFLSEYERGKKKTPNPEHWDKQAFDEYIKALEMDLECYQDEVEEISAYPVHYGYNSAVKYLKLRNISFDPEGDNLTILAHYMSRALAELTRAKINEKKQKAYTVSDLVFDVQKINKQQVEEDLKPKKTIASLFDEYLDNPKDPKSDGTKKSYIGIRNVINEVWGKDKAIDEITRDDCKALFDILLALPLNLKKKAPNLTIQNGIIQGKKEGWKTISHKTINNYMGNLNAVMRYAASEEYIDKNPSRNLTKKVTDENERLPYTKEQLKSMFENDFYTKAIDNEWHLYPDNEKQKHADMFWIPLISLYTGARMNEICQLEISDIKWDKEIAYFNGHVRLKW
jgi:integrase